MRKDTSRNRTTRALALVLCAAVVWVRALDPFIADESEPQSRAPESTPPKPAAPTPARQPPVSSPAKPPQPPVPSPPQQAMAKGTPTPPPRTGDSPKPGEAAVPQSKTATDMPVPIATGPAKPIVRSPSLNVTAVPTAAPAKVKRGEAVDTKKTGAALFDVKAGDTHVAISPSGDVIVRNPDVSINTVRVVQMIAGIVQAVKHVMESAKPAHREPADLSTRKAEGDESESKPKSGEESEEEEEENGNGENSKAKAKGKGAAAAGSGVIVKQKVTIVAGDDDDDGVDARMQPIPSQLIGDTNAISTRPLGRRDSALVDDAKPYARKLHYRVRRDYTRGGGSVGDVRFDGRAPITLELQQVSTIPRSEFAPDSYRFAVDVPGRPTFFLELPIPKA